ncbi:MAG: metallophosphoesterase family protein [Sphingomonadaceae bacterium]
MVLRRLFARSDFEPRARLIPEGQRVYAIGDIHGRKDCLKILLRKIDADDAARPPAETTLVLLGDLVDRGEDSRGVVETAMQLAKFGKTIFLMGNHEETLIRAWEGDKRATALFHRVGGRETLESYGVTDDEYEACDLSELATLIASRVPLAHIAFMRSFIDQWACGDYLFVHAGIRPGVALDEQSPSDLRWIRKEFLDDRRDHGPMIVHGHSITEHVDEQPNRIGIDTGAFASSCLTAIGLEGDQRWFLSTAP